MTYKLITSLAISLLFTFNIEAQIEPSDQTIFLVRHAEKADDGTRDPDLTAEGKRRATKLAAMLSTFDIKSIYSTDYKRTRNTALPLCEMLGVPLKIYDPRSDKIQEEVKSINGNVLIVGHSNSTPTLTNAILGENRYQQLDEKVYSKLFILSRVKGIYGSAMSEF